MYTTFIKNVGQIKGLGFCVVSRGYLRKHIAHNFGNDIKFLLQREIFSFWCSLKNTMYLVFVFIARAIYE